jgi:hypothetical protein
VDQGSSAWVRVYVPVKGGIPWLASPSLIPEVRNVLEAVDDWSGKGVK